MNALHRVDARSADPLLGWAADNSESILGKYRLHVIASSVPEAVELAGGAICDRTLSGWEVTVDVPADSDSRPITILGARVRDTATVAGEEYPDAIVVLKCGAAKPASGTIGNVGHWRTETSGAASHPRAVSHQLSGAAVAFKRCALQAAARGDEPQGRTEHFRWVPTG